MIALLRTDPSRLYGFIRCIAESILKSIPEYVLEGILESIIADSIANQSEMSILKFHVEQCTSAENPNPLQVRH